LREYHHQKWQDNDRLSTHIRQRDCRKWQAGLPLPPMTLVAQAATLELHCAIFQDNDLISFDGAASPHHTNEMRSLSALPEAKKETTIFFG
jgi:hypothetical protein